MPRPRNQAEALAMAMRSRTAPLTHCISCESTAVADGDFTDDLSRREFRISRLCQKCQDGAFRDPEDEEEFDG